MKKKVFSILLAVAMLASLTVGCGGKEEPADVPETTEEIVETKDEVIVAMGFSSEPESGFDPAYGWGAGEHVHEPLIQSTLTVTTKDLEIAYDLATDMQVSEDGLTWTVKIRDGVKFTDGEALTAEDVAFTYNTVKTTSSVNDFTMLKEAVAVDDTTVEFHMEKEYSIWPYTMAIVGIVPEHAYGPDYGSNPIGSGRYIMKQWDKGQQIIFEANPDYYGEEVKMKKVTVVFMEEDSAFAAAKAGQVDLAYTAASYSEQTIEGYELLAFASVDNRGFNLPAAAQTTDAEGNVVGNDFTNDVLVRRAINIGIDREQMIENVMYGYGTPAYSVCDKMPWYNEVAEVSYDPEAAATLLDEAGWVMGTDGIREKDGVKAAFTLRYPASDSVRQAWAADTANQLKALGIEDKVLILSNIKKTEEYYNASDLFVLPAKYEGMSIVSVEAQVTGLGCLLSDNVPFEIDTTPLVKHLSLDDGVEKWAETAIQMADMEAMRNNYYTTFVNGRFDVKQTVKDLCEIYEQQ